MFKEKFGSFKKLFKNDNLTEKKKIENLVFLLILLIITVIAVNIIWKGEKNPNANTNNNKQLAGVESNYENIQTNITNDKNSEYNLKKDLENILSKIKGAGKVQVLVTYTQSSQVVAMYNENVKQSTTEEKDTDGGVRTIEQKDNNKEVIYTEENGQKFPVTETVLMPKIEGAVILAEGANDAEIKNSIIQAVEAVTGLSAHKIQVFELKQEG